MKWKNVKYHTERSKYPFHHGVEISSFQPEVKGNYLYLKKNSPRVEISPPGEFHLAYV